MKNEWKVCFKLTRFSNFQTYFYMKTLVDYDYNMKILKTHWYILVFHPFESIKNPITIVFSSDFHILVQKWDKYVHILSFSKMYLNAY
jgi:hypothetical protein